MHRTTILLPFDLEKHIEERAGKAGLSKAEFIRKVLEEYFIDWKTSGKTDTLLDDDAVFSGTCPDDLSINHDAYLYGDPE